MSATLSQEHARLTIDGVPYEVLSLEGVEGLSRLFRFEVVCRRTTGPRGVLGREAVITLRDGLGAERSVHGVVAQAAERMEEAPSGNAEDGAALVVVVCPRLFTFTLGRCSRVFQDASALEIVSRVLGGAAGPFRWELLEAHPPHVYCAQYREDDFTFVARLLEEEGIFFWFDHDDGPSTLVFGDSSTRAQELAGGALIPMLLDTGSMVSGREQVHDVSRSVRAGPTRFTVGSFDPARPRRTLRGGVGSGELEMYDAPGGGPAPVDLLARIHAEAAGAARGGIAGHSNSVRLVPGRFVELDALTGSSALQAPGVARALASLEGRFLVTEASYRISQRRRDARDDAAYACRFRAIPREVPFRAPQVTPEAGQPGLQGGVVVGPGGAEIHPDDAGHVRVQLHWDREGARDERAGKWMRVTQRATDGSLLLPRVGWNVVMLNEEGVTDAPQVVRRIHDAEHPPEYPLPATKTQLVYKTATSPGGGSFNEVTFEDAQGSEDLRLVASRDMTVLVKHDKNERVGRDSAHRVGVDHTLTVGVDMAEKVLRDQSVTVGGDESLTVGGARAREVRGSEAEGIGGQRGETVGATFDGTVKETRSLHVGTALVDTAFANITTQALGAVTTMVGGAAVRVTGASMTEKVGAAALQAIGGVKLEVAAEDRAARAKAAYIETVGGVMVLTTDADFTDESSLVSSFQAGAAIAGDAPDVAVEATEGIVLTCGGSSITVLPGSVEIAAAAFDIADAEHIVGVGDKISLN